MKWTIGNKAPILGHEGFSSSIPSFICGGLGNVRIWISKNVISQVMMKSSKLISLKFSFFNLFQSTWKRSIITLQSVWAANDAKAGLERKTLPPFQLYKCNILYKTCYRGEKYVGKNWHFDIPTYGLSSSACLFSPVIICHLLASLSLLCCSNKLSDIQGLDCDLQHYYCVDQVTDLTPHTVWTCENNQHILKLNNRALLVPDCHNKQGQQIRWERSLWDRKYCSELLCSSGWFYSTSSHSEADAGHWSVAKRSYLGRDTKTTCSGLLLFFSTTIWGPGIFY